MCVSCYATSVTGPTPPRSGPRTGSRPGAGSSPKLLRPWYLVAAMALTWMVGVLTATRACKDLGYLRGAHEAMDHADAALQAARAPTERIGAVVEKSRLHAYAERHRIAFPLSLARTMLYAALALVSGAAIAGRKGARPLALQLSLAAGSLAVLTYGALEPVRLVVADAVAADAALHAGALPFDATTDLGPEGYRQLYLWTELGWLCFLLVVVHGSAVLALTRRRTKEFFDAIARERADAEQSDSEP